METEVAIVGAGPAGLSAAVAASEAGCRVTIVDAYARPGGQYYKQMPGEFHPRRPETLYHDFSQAQQLFAKLDDHARVQVLSGTTVWTVQAASTPGDPVTLYLNTGAGSVGLRAEKVILAPGAYDRVLPFPGWDLPGVMTMGAAQTLVKSQRVLPGQRVVLSGSGPFLLPVAAGLAQAGAQVVAVYEATTPLQWVRHAPRVWNHWDKLREGGDYVQLLRKQGVPLQFGRAGSGTIGTSCGKVATMYSSCASKACRCNLGEQSSELAEKSECNTSPLPGFRLIGSLSQAVRSREKSMLFASGMALCLRSNYRLCWVVRIVTILSRQPSLCNTMQTCRAAARESL